MELKTYEDTFESIHAHYEFEIAKKDDRILELESELEIEKQRTQDALNQIADYEMRNKLRQIKEYEKLNQKEPKTVFAKVFPSGIKMLKDSSL